MKKKINHNLTRAILYLVKYKVKYKNRIEDLYSIASQRIMIVAI